MKTERHISGHRKKTTFLIPLLKYTNVMSYLGMNGYNKERKYFSLIKMTLQY